MFKVGDKVVKLDGEKWDIGTYKTVRIADEYGFIMLHGDNVIYCEEELKLYQEEIKMEKNFREVVANIKEGEIWECTVDFYDIKSIEMSDGFIRISKQNKGTLLTLREETTFKLKRKTYSFEEAFKAYEEGKEIESIYGYRYKNINESDHMYSKDFDTFVESLDGIYIKEIRGKWYIND